MIMNPEYQKLLDILAEHKEHSYSFREDMKVGLNTVAMEIKELSNHQKIANGRTGKLEETVNNLQKADVLMGEQFKNMKDGSKKISDRMWMLIVGVGIAVIVTIFNKFLIR